MRSAVKHSRRRSRYPVIYCTANIALAFQRRVCFLEGAGEIRNVVKCLVGDGLGDEVSIACGAAYDDDPRIVVEHRQPAKDRKSKAPFRKRAQHKATLPIALDHSRQSTFLFGQASDSVQSCATALVWPRPGAIASTLDHGPVDALQWPAMTMTFKTGDLDMAPIKTGDHVAFEFTMKGMEATLSKIDRQ